MIEFTKMHSLGNDFIIISKKNVDVLNIKKICDRKYGIGADGVILYENNNVVFFNPDSSTSNTCGNGLRCIARFLADKKIVNSNKFEIILPNRIALINIENDTDIQVDMGEFDIEKSFFINYKNQNIKACKVFLGNHHLVLFLDDLSKLNIENFVEHINNNIEHNSNIEFIKIKSKEEILMRVWELGVGETKACGSGACASLIASNYLKLSNEFANVIMPGGSLKCEVKNKNVILKGNAQYVFNGLYFND